jgi:hypothetical protein
MRVMSVKARWLLNQSSDEFLELMMNDLLREAMVKTFPSARSKNH